jgi:hypothetical protein
LVCTWLFDPVVQTFGQHYTGSFHAVQQGPRDSNSTILRDANRERSDKGVARPARGEPADRVGSGDPDIDARRHHWSALDHSRAQSSF